MRRDDELRREFDSHIEEATEEYVQRGLSPTEARAAAHRDFGSVLQATESYRDVRRGRIGRIADSLLRDVRDSMRFLWRQPLFTIGVVLILSFGLGLLTFLVTVVNAQLFRPWQVPDPASMAIIWARPAGAEMLGGIRIAEYRFLRDRAQTVRAMAAWVSAQSVLNEVGPDGYRAATVFVNADYFNALEIGMTEGRSFSAGEEDYDAPKAVAIISERLWREQFSHDPSIVGRSIHIDRQPFTVVGVAERGFDGLERDRTEVWLPLPALAIAGSRPIDAAHLIAWDSD